MKLMRYVAICLCLTTIVYEALLGHSGSCKPDTAGVALIIPALFALSVIDTDKSNKIQ